MVSASNGFWKITGRIMTSEIDDEKLEKMWRKILEYEKEGGLSDSNSKAVNRIVEVINEVYKECF